MVKVIPCLLLCFASVVFAADIDLAWDPSPDADTVGYNFYWGPNQRGNANKPREFDYGNHVNVGLVTAYTIQGLSEATPWCFAVTAWGDVDKGHLESEYSNEVCIGFKTLGAPGSLRVIKVTIPNP